MSITPRRDAPVPRRRRRSRPSACASASSRYAGSSVDGAGELLARYAGAPASRGLPHEPIDVWGAIYSDREMTMPTRALPRRRGRPPRTRSTAPLRLVGAAACRRAPASAPPTPSTSRSRSRPLDVDGWRDFVGAAERPCRRGRRACRRSRRRMARASRATGEPGWPRWADGTDHAGLRRRRSRVVDDPSAHASRCGTASSERRGRGTYRFPKHRPRGARRRRDRLACRASSTSSARTRVCRDHGRTLATTTPLVADLEAVARRPPRGHVRRHRAARAACRHRRRDRRRARRRRRSARRVRRVEVTDGRRSSRSPCVGDRPRRDAADPRADHAVGGE